MLGAQKKNVWCAKQLPYQRVRFGLIYSTHKLCWSFIIIDDLHAGKRLSCGSNSIYSHILRKTNYSIYFKIIDEVC